MPDSASDSRNSGSDNFPFSDAPAVPPVGSNETVIVDQEQLINSAAESSQAGAFELNEANPVVSSDVTSDADIASRLTPGSLSFEPGGVQLGHFEIESLIGSGGMGAVFKANDTTLQRTVALKILSLKHSRNQGLVARFLNEARSCARLNHENIARIFFIGEDKGIHFIAFEYVAGKNLREILKERNWLTSAEALNFTLQIAFALKQTSAEGVVHRDIKPSNIIVTETGRAKLVDLGLARKSGDDSVADLTAFGDTLGTFDFIAPEQARDPRGVDIRSDIYSLGCTLYNMLTGQPPYPDGTALQKLLERTAVAPPDPRSINPAVSEDLALIVQRMMHIKIDNRYQTAQELIGDLLSVGAHNGLRGINPESLIWIQPKEQKVSFFQKYAVWFMAAAAMFLALGLMDFFPTTSRIQANNNLNIRPAVPTPVVSDARPPGTEDTSPTMATTSTTEDKSVENPTTPNNDDPRNGGSEMESDPSTIASATTIEDTGPLLTGIPPNESEDPGFNPNSVISPLPLNGDAKDVGAIADRKLISLESNPTKGFQSLEAAITEAGSGDVIKLRFDGFGGLFAEKRPAWITRKNITIRAESGYRPIIRFDISEELIESDNAIIRLVGGGSVDLVDVDLQVYIPDLPQAARWALFALQGTDRVRLDNVNIRFINASQRDASVFVLKSGSRSDLIRNDGTMPDDESFRIKIEDCWINGNCSLFDVSDRLEGEMDVANTALALGSSLMHYSAEPDMESNDRGRVELQLEHVTCLVGENLIKVHSELNSGSEQRLLPVNISANNNIFCSVSSSPMVSMSGNGEMDEFKSMLTWNGNRNWYERIGSLWQIDSTFDDAVEDYDFEGWREHWRDQSDSSENGAVAGESVFRSQSRSKAVAELRLTDLTLDETSEAIGGATDGKNVGADWRLLPPNAIPPEDE